MEKSDTELTAYNGTNIYCYGALHAQTVDEHPVKRTHAHDVSTHDGTYYIADTPGPAIIGLPASVKLGVVQMNCSVNVATTPTPQALHQPQSSL